MIDWVFVLSSLLGILIPWISFEMYDRYLEWKFEKSRHEFKRRVSLQSADEEIVILSRRDYNEYVEGHIFTPETVDYIVADVDEPIAVPYEALMSKPLCNSTDNGHV